MRYVYYCRNCGYLGSMDGEDKNIFCPECGESLFSTHVSKDEWIRMDSREKNDLKERWKEVGEKKVREKRGVERFSGELFGIPDLVYRIEGARGRSIDIYPYKCVITTSVTIGSVLTKNATDGEKTIYYQDCLGFQVKNPGLTLGYIQFETAAMTQNNFASNFFNENTFTFEPKNMDEDETAAVVKYIKGRLDAIKAAQRAHWMR